MPGMNGMDIGTIEINQLCKIYKLYNRPSDRLREIFYRKKMHHSFASLNNISLSVQKGESIGIIGENGAGKSTLLKIIANTLTPSIGRITVNGRVGMLLELGAGFEPELSGRQNYYLNAALAGLSRREVIQREEEILSFAEIGEFVDQPVKAYSSGMAVKLAFSIATNIDPDILVIDEVLSVGDQYFQKKSLDRILGFKNTGKTIVFCSHSMYFIQLICDQVIWLKNGKIEMAGNSADVTTAYENYQREKSAVIQAQPEFVSGHHSKSIKSILLNNSPDPVQINQYDDLLVTVEIESTDDSPYVFAIGFFRNDGLYIHGINLSRDKNIIFSCKAVHRVQVSYKKIPLIRGEFMISTWLLDESGIFVYQRKNSKPVTVISNKKRCHEAGIFSIDYSLEPSK
jgi:ABC-type polysaccharide/polyol phosphate transport system ATPase subunit